MSQSGSESDIWEYKPLRQIKRQTKTSDTNEHGAKRQKCPKKVSSKKKGSVTKAGGSSSINSESKADTDGVSPELGKANRTRPKSAIKSVNLPGAVSPPMPDVSQGDGAPQSKGFCPVCQIPFSVVVVQSAQWHVAECLETPGETEKECPDGLQCTSSIPAHYKKFSHSLLAHRRAINTTNSTTLDYTPSHLEQKSFVNEATICSKECSVDSAIGLSTGSSQSASPTCEGKESKSPNALQLLRSPGPEDIKKKKGWSPSTKGSRSQKSSKEPKITISTPVKAKNHSQNGDISRELDDYISYSPLSELPADTEEKQSRKRLFHSKVLVEKDEAESDCDSLILFNDTQSDDDILADVLDHYEKGTSQVGPVIKESVYTPDQSFESTECSIKGSSTAGGVDEPCSSTLRISEGHHLAKVSENNPQLPSPQRLVLERLRESISHPTQFTNFNSACTDSNSDSVNQKMPFTQTSKNLPSDINQKKDKLKTSTTCLKQTDIGVFFGLKPLKEKAEDVANAEERPQVRSESAVQKGKRQNKQQWRSKAVSEVALTTADVKEPARPTQPEGNGAVRQWGRKRWNRGRTTDGGSEEFKQCPFYKKIPGTSFVVDAFQYGTIKGITAYFLTHFHSDHYGGLNKNSTLPVYCNKITGNLVMRKLKVHEQYVHILLMNKECIVDGVRVTLLDANHCPGSAMLRLLLPDGQTVLHTGDFRADPSMELYPELQDIRIQTLYLDTTYCSPEYTFPTQQEVISFAANTAFEMVTLNPRTLVVCGTYSVGKEKVFLAISEVLGSKVYMSREKYQTMCCLETEKIGQYTTNIKAAQVHVLPMMQLNFKNLTTYLQRLSGTYDQLVAFKPTGWTFTQSVGVENIHPEIKGNISIYGIPYSEHSSFLELKRFVQWLQPLKIIPTVNVGSSASRKAMNNYFREWQSEVKSVKALPHGNRS